MNIINTSKVKGKLEWVYSNFNEDLFKYLLPPGAKLMEFGGSKKGDIVHLKLPLAGEWISEITEDKSNGNEIYFIDEGRKLPFPLKAWRHKHILKATGEQTIIEDNMTFTTGLILSDILFYPVLYLSFLPRKWQYKGYFNKLNK